MTLIASIAHSNYQYYTIKDK